MKPLVYIVLGLLLLLAAPSVLLAQTTNSPAPYCNGGYSSGTCNQGGPSNTPGNFVNDFIDDFATSGASGTNISNLNSGCNGGPNNYVSYCQQYLSVSPGDVITCTIQSGIIYSQGFAIWVDWNQDNTFGSGEQVAATIGFPAAATPTVLTFTVPSTQAPGAYRMRVRCAFATSGVNLTPCGQFGYGETEDYMLYVGSVPANAGVTTATATGNATVCAGESVSLSVTSSNALSTYTWTGPNSYSSTLQNPVLNNATPAISGIYTVVTSGNCPASKTINVVVAPDPSFVLTPSVITICQGNHFTASAQLLNSFTPNAFTYNWACNAPPAIFQTPAPGVGIYSPGSQSTLIGPSFIVSPQEILVYTVVVTPTVHSCPVVHTLTLTINNPVTPTITLPTAICNTGASISLTATPGGGTWAATSTLQTAAMQPNGLFVPGSVVLAPNFGGATVGVLYSVHAGTCTVQTTGTINVSQFVAPTLISSLTTLCTSTAEPSVDLMSLVQNTLNGSWSGIGVVANHFSTTYPSNLPTGIYNLTYNTLSSPNQTACPGSTVLAVSVFNPPSPNIAAILPRCNNTGTIQLTASPNNNLLWTGNVGVSSTGVLSPSACTINSPTFTNTIYCTGGLGTCVATSSLNFEIDEFRTAALSAIIPALCVNSNPVNLMSVVQNTLGGWSPNNNISTINNIFSPAGLLTGTYVLTYTNASYPDPNLCPSTHTIAVSVLNPPTANIVQVGPYCSIGGPVQLTVTPNIGSWVASSYLSGSGAFTPSLSPVGNNLVQYIIGTNTCNTQQTSLISVEAFVPATISNSIPDQCVTNLPVNLQPFTVSNQGSWSGPGILGSTFNPSIAGPGQTTISYHTASSPSGLCPDQATISVNTYSLATPVISPAGPFCTSAMPQQLPVSPVGGIFGGANTGAISAEGLFIPASAQIGKNIVSYSITLGPCVAYAQTTIAVEQFVTADFISTAGPFCNNDPRLSRNLNEIVENPGGIWSGAGVNPLTGVFTFTDANIADNNIIFYGTHSVPTATLCPDTKTVQIAVYDTPSITASADFTMGCAPLKVKLKPNTNFGEGEWIYSDNSATDNGLNAQHIFTAPGSYSIAFNYSVMVATDFMCTVRAIVPSDIKVFDTPTADFTYLPDAILISDPLVHFTNTSTGVDHNRYLWTMAGNNASTVLHDVDADFTFPQAGDYQVTLSATSLNGCKSDITKMVTVKSVFNVYIPTSFTPNNDGLNDVFFPVFSEYGLDDATYFMQIFDRWGTLLFESKDRSLGWNGTASSHPVKQDAYVFRLRFKDVDGNVYNKTGFITLIR